MYKNKKKALTVKQEKIAVMLGTAQQPDFVGK